jgi:hypothetical protein
MIRLLSIPIAAIVLLLSGGVDVLIHTCGGETTVEMMPSSTDDPCGCDDDATSDPCCTLVVKTFCLDDMQKSAKETGPQTEKLLIDTVPDGVVDLTLRGCDAAVRTESPPHSFISLPILHCSFLV